MGGLLKISCACLLLMILSGCGSTKVANPTSGSSKESLSDRTSVWKIMNYLTSNQLMGRDTGSEGIEKAALFIEDQLRINRVAPYFRSFRDTLTNFPEIAYNIVGLVEGNDPELKDEYIILGAHYDHIGLLPSQDLDTIANGANDNASGTTTVLELAKYFGRERTNGRSLIFAFFSAEEEGLVGSRHLAKKLKEQELPLYVMLNFEMTGVPLVDKPYFMYVTGYNRSNLAAVCNSYTDESLVGYLPTAEEFNLFQRSDNYPFHQEFEVPSQTFCTFDFTNFEHYHQVGDELERMDLEHMVSLVNKMIPILEGISTAPERQIHYY